MNTLSLTPEEQDALRGEFAGQLSLQEGMTPLHTSIGAASLVQLDDFCRRINIDDYERNEILTDATTELAENMRRVGRLGKIVTVSSSFLDDYKKRITDSDYLFFDSPSSTKR